MSRYSGGTPGLLHWWQRHPVIGLWGPWVVVGSLLMLGLSQLKLLHLG
jgi:hypothetical protein